MDKILLEKINNADIISFQYRKKYNNQENYS